MSGSRRSFFGRRVLCAAVMILCASGAIGAARPDAAAQDFLYHAAPHDTLIGIGRRMLIEPRRWRELQARNRIADPRRIPRGQILRIPYAWLKLSGESATVVSVAGQVESGGKRLANGDLLPQGSVIRTGEDGSVTLDLADGSVVSMQKSSVLTLDEMVRVTGVAAARSIRLKLDSGRVETTVKPHRDVGRFEIVTPVAVSAVRGTQFRDSFADDDSHATTETLEGTVGVANDSDAVAVAAGFGTRIEPGRAPLEPVALLPPPDLSQVPRVNTLDALQGSWPPVEGALQYRLQVSADPGFKALTADVVSAGGGVRVAGLPDGHYWLRVRSIDLHGIEGSDAVRQFEQHTLPPAPNSTSPASNAKVVGSRIRLTWSAVPAAASYSVQVAEEPTFRAPVLERQGLTAPALDIAALPPGRYFWRAAAINPHDEAGPWSLVQSFAQRPELPQPEVRVDRRQAIFGWPPVAGETYRLQISRDPRFLHAIVDRRIDVAHWEMPKPLPGVYYCRVQSIDAEGSGGAFSPACRFAVPIPLWAKVATPLAIGLALLL